MTQLAIPRFVPAGPVSAAFLSSRKRFRGLMGPFGSGKTSTALMDLIYLGYQQAPHPIDRVRRTKFGVIRATYRDLERTTLPSWRHWFPKAFPASDWHGGAGGQPAEHVLRFQLKDGTAMETILQFIAVGENSAEDTARGLELTGALLEEADLLPFDLVAWLDGRVGRYPAKDPSVGFEGATWRGLTMTFNAPDIEHPLYKMFVEDLKPDGPVAFFDQPGGLIEVAKGQYIPNPKAENLANLPADYYTAMVGQMPYWQLRRMVLNKWGASRDGAAVYPEYDDVRHCPATELQPIRGRQLLVGLDSSGLHGAAVIGQINSLGGMRIYDEVCSPKEGMIAGAYAELFLALLRDRYADWMTNFGHPLEPTRPAIKVTYDPAETKFGSDGKTWIQVFAAALKRSCLSIDFRPAPTNRLTPRIEAVRGKLTRDHGGEPAFQINRRCVITRRGFNSGYRLKRIRVEGTERYHDEPEKNECSHPHDGLQYLALGNGEFAVVLAGGDEAYRERRSRAPTQSEPYSPI